MIKYVRIPPWRELNEATPEVKKVLEWISIVIHADDVIAKRKRVGKYVKTNLIRGNMGDILRAFQPQETYEAVHEDTGDKHHIWIKETDEWFEILYAGAFCIDPSGQTFQHVKIRKDKYEEVLKAIDKIIEEEMRR